MSKKGPEGQGKQEINGINANKLALFTWIFSGKSPLDFPFPVEMDHDEYIRFMRKNGYDVSQDAEEVERMVRRAIDFTDHMFLQLTANGSLATNMPNSVLLDITKPDPKGGDRFERILRIAAGKERVSTSHAVAQANILAKILMTLSLYMEKTDEYCNQDAAYDALSGWFKAHFKKHDKGETFQTVSGKKIQIQYSTTGKKIWHDILRKLGVKEKNDMGSVQDRVRGRVVAETPSGLIQLLVELVCKSRIPWNLAANKKPKHQLVDLEKISRVLSDPEKYKAEFESLRKVLEKDDDKEAEKFYVKSGKKSSLARNDHTSEAWEGNSMSLVFDMPIDVNGEQRFYTVEIQFSYKERAQIIWSPHSEVYSEVEHQRYERSQFEELGYRLGIVKDKVRERIDKVRKNHTIDEVLRTIGKLGVPEKGVDAIKGLLFQYGLKIEKVVASANSEEED